MAAKIFLNLPNGTKMPALGLGTWQAKDEKELTSALETALELGYRHIDTAYVYENEAYIGKVLKKWLDSGKLKREELFITTKLPMVGVHEDRVELFMKKSLKNLQLDYVDLYLVHFPVGCVYDGKTATPVSENGIIKVEKSDHLAIWKKMEEQVDAGRTKAIGLSNFNLSQIQKILKTARIKPANLQVELHVFFQQSELVDFCSKNGITVTAYSPLGTPGLNPFLKSIGLKERDDLPSVLKNPVINKIAEKYSKTPAQIALRYLIQLGVAPIPKSTTPNRIQENIGVFDFELSLNDFQELKKLDVGFRICDFSHFPGVNSHPEFPFKA